MQQTTPTEQDPAAPDPATASVQRPRRGWLWFSSAGAAIVLVIGLVWLAGGFERRTDLNIPVPHGAAIATGPYAFTFVDATVQKTKDYSDKLIWQVVVSGTGRVTGDEAMAPSTLDPFFVARDVASRAVQEPHDQQFGADGRTGDGSFFTPGLAPLAYRLVFWFPADLDPPRAVELGVWQLEYRDRSLLKTGEKSWARGDVFYLYSAFPTKRLADDLD